MGPELKHLVNLDTMDEAYTCPLAMMRHLEEELKLLNHASRHKLKIDFYSIRMGDQESISQLHVRINDLTDKVNTAIHHAGVSCTQVFDPYLITFKEEVEEEE